MAKTETVKALALQAGVVWINGIAKPFKEGAAINWPADDAGRAEKNGVILIEQPAEKAK
jgi:hypothetical protein